MTKNDATQPLLSYALYLSWASCASARRRHRSARSELYFINQRADKRLIFIPAKNQQGSMVKISKDMSNFLFVTQ